MSYLKTRHTLLRIIVGLVVVMSFFSMAASAAVMSTQSMIQQTTQQHFDRDALQQLMQSEEAQQQLQKMGVSLETAEVRLASLTNAELVQFNQQLQHEPVGSSAVGVVLTVFIVFIITDMLCATDLFSFVKCINK
jgi:CBS domain containing-hemolysin-like protein